MGSDTEGQAAEIETRSDRADTAVEECPAVGFNLLDTQHGRGKRVSVPVESHHGSVADGFMISGPSPGVEEFVLAHGGWAKYARSDRNPHGVRVGGIRDEDFARSLRAAHREKLLGVGSGEVGRAATR